jgi:hypothetical protein
MFRPIHVFKRLLSTDSLKLLWRFLPGNTQKEVLTVRWWCCDDTGLLETADLKYLCVASYTKIRKKIYRPNYRHGLQNTNDVITTRAFTCLVTTQRCSCYNKSIGDITHSISIYITYFCYRETKRLPMGFNLLVRGLNSPEDRDRYARKANTCVLVGGNDEAKSNPQWTHKLWERRKVHQKF